CGADVCSSDTVEPGSGCAPAGSSGATAAPRRDRASCSRSLSVGDRRCTDFGEPRLELTLASSTPGPLYSRRAATVRRTFAEPGLDALIVTHPPNLRYLTGFDGSVGVLLLESSGAVLFVDGRYIT